MQIGFVAGSGLNGLRFATFAGWSFQRSLEQRRAIMTVKSWFSKMTGTEMHLDNLENVLLMQLEDLYDAERQLIDAIPKMADAASSAELQAALRNHLSETRGQKTRLETAFRMLG